MKYNRYIKSVPKVSEIGLGAWQLGSGSGWTKEMTEKEAVYLVHQALEEGVNFFDTAPNYGYGSSEERLGMALKGTDRSKIVVNTKFGHTDKGTQDYSSGYIRESLEGSLRRLKMDYVDSLIIHNPPSEYLDGNKNDHYEILERLKEEGKIKAYGASLDSKNEMELFMGTTNCEVIEAFFNILWQDVAGAFPMAQEKGVGIIVKIPLDSGWLSGKYTSDSRFNDVRGRWSENDIRTRAKLVDRVREIIGPDANMVQTAIAWCLSYDAVSTVIPGNANLEQLMGNLESTGVQLAPELVQKLETFYEDEVRDLKLPW